jgi:transposase
MGYTREERLDIGKQIYHNEISKSDAAIKYKISEGTARDYMRLYRDANGLPPKNRIQKEGNTVKISVHSSEPDLSEYESMTKEELIKELVKSRIREARLKKGYEVKGAGADRTVTIFDRWNMK